MAKFEKYFKGIKYDVHSIPGRTFPVDRIYLKSPVSDYKPEIYRTISDIIQKKLVGDILVFLISKSEIDEVYNKLQTMNLDKVAIYKMFRGVSEKEKMLAIDSEMYKKTTGHPTRKIVLTTNIGETGVTINGIKFVIDNGYNFAMSYDPKLRRNILLNERITKASAKQRAGRAGRTAPGTCYHLMTEAEFNKLPDAKPADIFVTNLEVLFLSLLSNKNFKLKDTKDLAKLLDNLIEPPKQEAFNATLTALYKFGILEKSGTTYKLTKLGNCVSGLQLDIELSVVLLVSKMLGIESEVLKIVSLMSIQPQLNKYFMKPDRNFDFDNAKKRKAYFKKLDRLQKVKEDKFASYQSELFSFYHIYQEGKEKDFSNRWFSYYLINPDIFRNLNKTYADFTNKIAEIDKECLTLLKDSLMSSQIIKDYYYERSEALKKFNQGRVERLTDFNQLLKAPLTTKMMICFIFAYQDNVVNVGKTTNDTIEIIMDKDNTFTMRRSPFLQRIGKQILYTDITVIDDSPTLVGLTNLN